MEEIIKKFSFIDNVIIINTPSTLEKEIVKLGFKTSFDKVGK